MFPITVHLSNQNYWILVSAPVPLGLIWVWVWRQGLTIKNLFLLNISVDQTVGPILGQFLTNPAQI